MDLQDMFWGDYFGSFADKYLIAGIIDSDFNIEKKTGRI